MTSGRRRADGTIGRPYSALNLRLALAVFGLVSLTLLTVTLVWAGEPALAVLSGVLGVAAIINIVVVQRRRVQRRRDEPGVRHSLFE